VKSTLAYNVEGLLRSLTFQTGFVSSMWVSTLGVSRYFTGDSMPVSFAIVCSAMGGLWGLVERASRRIELASFFVAHALFIAYKRTGIRPHGGVGAVLLALGVAPLIASWRVRKPSNVVVKTLFH
jgi:uncharacterized membrane protein YhhN